MWVTVFGGGSFCLGAGHKTWRGGRSYPVTLEEAEGVFEWLDAHPGVEWLLVSAEEPEIDVEPLSGMLTLADIKFGTHRRPVEDTAPPPLREPDRPDLVHECGLDGGSQRFPSDTALRRHVRIEHTNHHEEIEEEAREHVEREKAEKAERERIRQADPSDLHPAERLADESSEPPGSSLWPKGLGNFLP